MSNNNGKNLFDATLAGQYHNEAQPIQDINFAAKSKFYLKREQFLAPIGKPGYLKSSRTVKYAARVNNVDKAKITDFGQIKVAGRR